MRAYDRRCCLFLSFPALRGIGDRTGLRAGVPFCSSLWTEQRPCLHRHLLFDGLSLGVCYLLFLNIRLHYNSYLFMDPGYVSSPRR